MLHAIAKLGQHPVGHIERVLGNEIDADSLGADEAYHLLDPLQERLRGIGEQQMRLVEEEHEFWLVQVTDLGQFLKEFRQQPQQERGVEPRVLHQLIGGENVDRAAAVAIDVQKIPEPECRLAEELVGALVLQHQELALDGADGGLRHIAVLRGQFARMLCDETEHGA